MVPLKMINLVAQNISIPLIVGGGIVDLTGIQNAYDAGADLVVIGTAFEKHSFFNKTIKRKNRYFFYNALKNSMKIILEFIVVFFGILSVWFAKRKIY
jgi:dihydroorotate dehydrogenase